MTANDRADALLHEGIHYVAGGTDHIVKPGVVGNENHVVYQDHLHQDLGIGNPRNKDDAQATKNIIRGGGCT